MSKTSAQAKNRYNAKAYDRVNFVIKKGEKQALQDIATATNESINAYIKRAVKSQIKAETGQDIDL